MGSQEKRLFHSKISPNHSQGFRSILASISGSWWCIDFQCTLYMYCKCTNYFGMRHNTFKWEPKMSVITIEFRSVLELSMTQRYSLIKIIQQISQFVQQFFLLCVEFSSAQFTVDQLWAQFSSDLFQCHEDSFWSSKETSKLNRNWFSSWESTTRVCTLLKSVIRNSNMLKVAYENMANVTQP